MALESLLNSSSNILTNFVFLKILILQIKRNKVALLVNIITFAAWFH